MDLLLNVSYVCIRCSYCCRYFIFFPSYSTSVVVVVVAFVFFKFFFFCCCCRSMQTRAQRQQTKIAQSNIMENEKELE